MAAQRSPDFTHDALVHSGTGELASLAAPFLRAGHDSGDELVLVCTDRSSSAIVDELGSSDGITFLDRGDAYSKSVDSIAFFRRFLRDSTHDGGRQVRMVSEVDFGDDPYHWREWQRFEAACDIALSSYRVHGVCAYDTQLLPEPLVRTGLLTHRQLVTPDGRGDNERFTDPTELLHAMASEPHPAERDQPLLENADVWDIRSMAHALRASATAAGIGQDCAEDLTLAAVEVLTNAVKHGRPPVTVREWVHDKELVCTVTDRGAGVDDPFLGYGPIGDDALNEGGFGLWMSRRLCDSVTTCQGDDGFTVRLVLRDEG